MTTEEYQQVLRIAASAANLLSGFDIPELLCAIDRANSIGPVLNPSLWQEKREAMSQDRDLLEAARPLWLWAKRTAEWRMKNG